MTDKPTTPPDDLVSRTIKERSSIYGPPVESFNNIGLAFTALLQQHYGLTLAHPIPGWLATQMMAMFKIQRAARVFHADNYVDGHAYLRFAEEGQRPTAHQQSQALHEKDEELIRLKSDLERINHRCVTGSPMDASVQDLAPVAEGETESRPIGFEIRQNMWLVERLTGARHQVVQIGGMPDTIVLQEESSGKLTEGWTYELIQHRFSPDLTRARSSDSIGTIKSGTILYHRTTHQIWRVLSINSRGIVIVAIGEPGIEGSDAQSYTLDQLSEDFISPKLHKPPTQ